ncbi:MAG: hypothetical protein L0206_03855 [Actinobacteria bacterium]|nr:hypothetical protein [Actinomycetota bacterium]
MAALTTAVLAGNASAQTVCTGEFDPGGSAITAATPLGPVAGCDRIWGDEADEAFIVINGLLFVRDTELTILPGTIVRQQPRDTVFAPATPTVGTPGTLVVERGSFLNAQGTAGAPIIITTAAVDNNGVGGVGPADGIPDDDDLNGEFDDWTAGDVFWDDDPRNNPRSPLLATSGDQATLLAGGLVLLGFAPTNLDASATGVVGEGICEGLPVPGVAPGAATYGGTQPNDSTGLISYVGVRHAGDEISPANELNGITFCGVGRGTVVNHVEAYANGDDGIEMFGGNVDIFNYAASAIGDDIIDVDQGYTGNIQDAFTLAMFFRENDAGAYGTGGSGDAAGEFDGEDCPACTAPLRPDPAMVVCNWTHVSSIEGAINAGGVVNPAVSADVNNKEGLQADTAWNGIACNSLMIGFTGGAEPSMEFSGTGASPYICASSGDSSLNATALPRGTACDTAIAAGALALPGTPFNVLAIGPGSGSPNQFTNTPTVIPAAYQFLVNENYYFSPDGFGTGRLIGSKVNDAGVAAAIPMNPRLNAPADAAVSGGVEPLLTGFDPSETYRGAFGGSAGPLWIEGWTALSVGGIVD